MRRHAFDLFRRRCHHVRRACHCGARFAGGAPSDRGAAACQVVPRIGHLHITVDDARWHWVDASGEPLIVAGLAPGPHRVLLELADPTHRVVDAAVVELEIPQPSTSQRQDKKQ
jgi:hypothetical protein